MQYANIPEVELCVCDWSETPSWYQLVISRLHDAIRVHKQVVIVHSVPGAHSIQVPENVVREANWSALVCAGLKFHLQCDSGPIASLQVTQSVGGRAVQCSRKALLSGAARILEEHRSLWFGAPGRRLGKYASAPEYITQATQATVHTMRADRI